MASCSGSLFEKKARRLAPYFEVTVPRKKIKNNELPTLNEGINQRNLKWFGQMWLADKYASTIAKDLCLVCNARPGSAGHFLIVHSFSVIP